MHFRRTLGIGVAFAALLTACADDGEAGSTPLVQTAAASGTVPLAADSLITGDCLAGIVIGGTERRLLDSVDAVPCSGSHELEVIATFELQVSDFPNTTPGDYPGEQRIVDIADLGCIARLDELGVDRTKIGVIAAWPSASSWAVNDRAVACAAFNSNGMPFERPSLLAGSAR